MPAEESLYAPSQAIRASQFISEALKTGRKVVFWTPAASDVCIKTDNQLLRLLQEHGEGKVEVEVEIGGLKRVFRFTKLVVKSLYTKKK